MTPRDAFWAAKIIMRFTREEIEAIVETGEYSDSNVAQYFLDVFLERQAKCGITCSTLDLLSEAGPSTCSFPT